MILEKKLYTDALLEVIPSAEKIYYEGPVKLLKKPGVVIVGSRNPTTYGRIITEKLVEKLVLNGIVVISGFARGVDFCAQKAAIDHSGYTIGVLGCGLDIDYPTGRKAFIDQANSHLLRLTEYAPGTTPRPYHFPRRNRILAALSDDIIVIQGKRKSGTLITAYQGVELGKNIWALPGPISESLSAGPNYLISQGAYILHDIDYLIEDLKRRYYG